MAGRTEAKGKHRLPPEQQRELDKDGRCRRFFCDILRLRVVGYIVRQPTPFTFILSLFLISITLPLVGLYISRKEGLPDLDAMQNWNAYIGRLGRKDFCFDVPAEVRSDGTSLYDIASEDGGVLSAGPGNYTVGVMIDFLVNRTTLTPLATQSNSEDLMLYGSFIGSDFSTQIKDSTGKRIDNKIQIHFLLNTSAVNSTEACPGDSEQCKVHVGTCVLITAPGDAVPTRLPQVHHNATFVNKVFISGTNRRPKECSLFNGTIDFLKSDRNVSSSQMVYFKTSKPVRVRNITHCSSSKDDIHVEKVYLPGVQRGASKGHGIIRINLNQDDQKTAANHMYFAALAVAALAIAFAVCITFTDRPPQPKSSQE